MLLLSASNTAASESASGVSNTPLAAAAAAAEPAAAIAVLLLKEAHGSHLRLPAFLGRRFLAFLVVIISQILWPEGCNEIPAVG